MRISPTPDVVNRVFMLFRGVRPDDVGLWARRLLARLQRTARCSGRMWSALMRRARPIALCSECWNGADWKSN
ncbi:hypothetical protein BGY98DRAFT_1009232, partial [Russula aff. rugulosa BPL654]